MFSLIDPDVSYATFAENRPKLNHDFYKKILLEVRFMEKIRNILRVEHLMSRPPITVRKDESVQKAAKIMFDNRVGSVLVVDSDGKLVGIVTERDLVYLIARGIEFLASRYPVWEIMSEDPVTVGPDTSIQEAMEKMKELKIRHLPVVDDEGRPLGVISMRDIIELMLAFTDFIRKPGKG